MRLNFYKILWFAVMATLSAFTLTEKQTTLYIIGDSTAANKKAEKYPETGWGMELQAFFRDEVKVDNRALNGRSTKSFRAENQWKPILDQLKPGDYVFIQFGHNDEKIDKPDIGVSLQEFKTNLVRYVNETRSKKALPVLLTPISRRHFVNEVLIDTHGDYPKVTRAVADSLKVPLLDMLTKTTQLLNHLGDSGSIKLFLHVDSGHVNYPNGKKDDTHLNVYGAKQVALLVVEAIKQQELGLIQHLK
jgi:lysophospholipase L1-like esterase